MTQKPVADRSRRVARPDDLESLMTTGQAYNVAALYVVCHCAPSSCSSRGFRRQSVSPANRVPTGATLGTLRSGDSSGYAPVLLRRARV
jgi:hypothetical protein